MLRKHALAFIEGWKLDTRMLSFPQDIREAYPKIPQMMPIRAYLANCNKTASDALWDGKPNTALNALVNYGLGKQNSRYRTEAAGQISYWDKIGLANKKADTEHRLAARKSNWSVCK